MDPIYTAYKQINESVSDREKVLLIDMLVSFIEKFEVTELSSAGSIIGDAAWQAVNKVYGVATKEDLDRFTNAIAKEMK